MHSKRSIWSVQASGELHESETATSSNLAKRQHGGVSEEDILDRFSLRIVSALQGSTSLDDAQRRAREVLSELKQTFEIELTEYKASAEKYRASNKVLGRALVIMRNKSSESHQAAVEANAMKEAAEERARNLEHTVNVLRWHLQTDREAGGFKTPPDIF